MESESIYELRDGLLHPTEWAGSPWSEGLQHGGPLNALFARAAEQAARETGLQVARLTVDLFKPVPTEPLACRYRFARRGRRIANVEIELSLPGEDAPLSKATSVLLQPKEALGRSLGENFQPAPSRTDAKPLPFMTHAMRDRLPPGFHWSLETESGRDALGSFVSIHSPLALVLGEELSPLQHCAAVADLTFGLSLWLQKSRNGFTPNSAGPALINTDSSIHWERPPVGNRIFFRDSLITDQAGIGLASVCLFDEAGRLGRSTQTLLAQPGFAVHTQSSSPEP